MFTEVGAWKNYEELEESISLPELLKTIEAVRERTQNFARVVFASQGVNIDEESKQSKTVEDIHREAMEELYGRDVEFDEIGIIYDDQL